MLWGNYFRATCAALAVAAAVPASAQDTPPPLDAYGDLPGIEQVALSDSGTNIAAVSVINGRRMLMFLNSDMVLQNMIGIEDVKVRAIDWVGEDAVVVLRSDLQELSSRFTADSFEAVQAMILPTAKGAEPIPVFGGQSNITGAVMGDFGLRRVEGRWVGYYGGIELRRTHVGGMIDRGHPTLFEVDMATGKGKEKAAIPPRDWGRRWLVDVRGEIAATIDIDYRNGNWRIENAGHREIATGSSPEGDAGLVSIGKDGDTVLFYTDGEDGLIRYFEVPLDGSAPAGEVFVDQQLDGILRDEASGRLLGYIKAGESLPSFFDPARQATASKAFAPFATLHTSLVDWSSDFSRMVVRTSGNGDSGTLYFVDVPKRQAKPIGNERLKIAPAAVGPISRFAYTAQDGTELDGILTLPPGKPAKNLPVILFPHGGPHSHDEAEFDWWAQAFASRGYAVFQPNFRGSTNRDERFRVAGNGEWGGKMQTDVSDGLSALAKQGMVDPRRACIMGGSYGGYAALAGVTVQQGIYRCAVAVAPVADLEVLKDTELRESGRSGMVRRSLREEFGDRSDLSPVSPRQLAGKADAPILLIHGRDDTVVPFEHSTKMAAALSDAGKPYKMIELREEDHWLSRADTRKQMLSEAMAFVLEHNPPD